MVTGTANDGGGIITSKVWTHLDNFRQDWTRSEKFRHVQIVILDALGVQRWRGRQPLGRHHQRNRLKTTFNNFIQIQTDWIKFGQVQTSLNKLRHFFGKYTYLVTGTANDGGEDSPGGVITGETGLAHAGAIVNNQSGGIFVTHVG